MISFEGQVAAITGAGNGIGLATARLMAAHGARLVLTDIDNARLQDVAAELDPSGQRVYTHALDVSVSHDCERVFEAAARHFGGLDHLVHCAGIYPEQLVKDTSDEAWRTLMRINLDGTFYACRAAQRSCSSTSWCSAPWGSSCGPSRRAWRASSPVSPHSVAASRAATTASAASCKSPSRLGSSIVAAR